MRHLGTLSALAAAAFLWVGCRTPFKPATVPVANLYPTLNPSGILATTRPLVLSGGEASALLAHLGALGPLRAHGMGSGELPLVLRGLERHGYAELDARRTTCPVRWVVLRCVEEADRPLLVVEVGSVAPPAAAAHYGLDLGRPAAATGTRSDAYGRVSRVETWIAVSDQPVVQARRITAPGQAEYWELEYRAPVQVTVPGAA
jgi:hypothetical protein